MERELARGAPTKKTKKASKISRAGSRAKRRSVKTLVEATPPRFRRAERPSKTFLGVLTELSAKKASAAVEGAKKALPDEGAAGVLIKSQWAWAARVRISKVPQRDSRLSSPVTEGRS